MEIEQANRVARAKRDRFWNPPARTNNRAD
jgi:hypothetical protein